MIVRGKKKKKKDGLQSVSLDSFPRYAFAFSLGLRTVSGIHKYGKRKKKQ